MWSGASLNYSESNHQDKIHEIFLHNSSTCVGVHAVSGQLSRHATLISACLRKRLGQPLEGGVTLRKFNIPLNA